MDHIAQYSDCRIIPQDADTYVEAHKVIFAQSRYFKALFENKWMDTDCVQIDETYEEFEPIINYLYRIYVPQVSSTSIDEICRQIVLFGKYMLPDEHLWNNLYECILVEAPADIAPLVEFCVEFGYSKCIFALFKMDMSNAIPSNFEQSKLDIPYNADLNMLCYDFQNILHYVCEINSPKCVKIFIEAGVDLNTVDIHGETALSLACYNDVPECVRLLVDAGADLNMTNMTEYTALHNACIGYAPECVKLLIHAGARLDSQDESGNTALSLGCGENSYECVKLLVDAGADVDVQNVVGETALHVACVEDYDNCTKVLIDIGADLDLRNTYGDTALDYALHRSNHYDFEDYNKAIKKCAKLLIAAGVKN